MPNELEALVWKKAYELERVAPGGTPDQARDAAERAVRAFRRIDGPVATPPKDASSEGPPAPFVISKQRGL